jgi:hypothetical protein
VLLGALLLPALFNAATLRDAGLVRFVLRALRAILDPNLALVLFSLILALTLGAAKHCPMFDTILFFLMPEVHLYLRTTLFPDFAHIRFSNIADTISLTSITLVFI